MDGVYFNENMSESSSVNQRKELDEICDDYE